MNQQQPVPSPTPSRAGAFSETLKYFCYSVCRPFLLGIFYLVMDSALASITLILRLLRSLWRVIWPILRTVIQYLLIRLAVMLLLLYLGSKLISWLL